MYLIDKISIGKIKSVSKIGRLKGVGNVGIIYYKFKIGVTKFFKCGRNTLVLQ